MKKVFALILALAMVFALVACNADGSVNEAKVQEVAQQVEAAVQEAAAAEPAAAEPAAAEPAQKTVGIAMPTKSLERWNRDGAYLKEQFEASGYKCLLTYSDNDVEQQNNDIANMIAEGVDLLVIVAIDSDSLTQTLKDVECPIIAYDRCINAPNVQYYVSFDNYQVGVLQGQYVEKALDLANAADGTVYNIEFTAGDPADTNAAYFFNGAKDTLQTYLDKGTLKVISEQTAFEQVATAAWSTDTALDRFQNILASFYADGTVLDVALCSNDSTALGVGKAITSDYAGSNAPIVTGQDGDIANLKNIVDGVQTMTVYKNVADEAGVTLVLGQALLGGDAIDANLCSKFAAEAAFDTDTYTNGTSKYTSFLLVPYSIDKDNLQLLVDTGLYKWDADNKYLEAVE